MSVYRQKMEKKPVMQFHEIFGKYLSLKIYLEQCFSFSGIGIVDIFFPLKKRMFIHDIHFVKIDKGSQ